MICGGADIANQLMQKNLIDKYFITIIPTILGDGIPFFYAGKQEIKIRLAEARHMNGMAELIYEKR